MTRRAQWILSVLAAFALVALLVADFNRNYYSSNATDSDYWMFMLFAFVAIATARTYPSVALAAGWGAGLTQLLTEIPLVLSELPLIVVLFCAARWGRVGTVLAAGLTSVLAAFLVLLTGGAHLYFSPFGKRMLDGLGVTTLAVLGLAVLVVPWLAGLALRFLDRASQASQAQHSAEEVAHQAQEVARLREEQNRLARDVHDVVGHSLAVILAQAESAQFLDDQDTTKLKLTMANIASSARTSLQDVRHVLTPDSAGRTPVRLENLLSSVAEGSGREVVVDQLGEPRPLPPELEEVAYRVAQEMLTNALKHGERGSRIQVELAWPEEGGLADSLRIEVGNAVDPAALQLDGAGRGLEGMRRRLASVGGHLDVRRRPQEQGLGEQRQVFTAAAWVPIRDLGGTDASQ